MLFYILNGWQSNDQPFDMFNHHETWHMEDTETFIAALDLKFHFKFLGQVMSIDTALGCQHHDRHTDKHSSYVSSALMVVLSQFEILKLLHRLRKTIWPTSSKCNHPKHAHKTNQNITPHNSWLRVEKQKMQVYFRNISRFVTLLDCSAWCCRPVAMTLWRPWRCFSPPAWRTPSSERPQRQAHEGRWGGSGKFSWGPFCRGFKKVFSGLKWWTPNWFILAWCISLFVHMTNFW